MSQDVVESSRMTGQLSPSVRVQERLNGSCAGLSPTVEETPKTRSGPCTAVCASFSRKGGAVLEGFRTDAWAMGGARGEGPRARPAPTGYGDESAAGADNSSGWPLPACRSGLGTSS